MFRTSIALNQKKQEPNHREIDHKQHLEETLSHARKSLETLKEKEKKIIDSPDNFPALLRLKSCLRHWIHIIHKTELQLNSLKNRQKIKTSVFCRSSR